MKSVSFTSMYSAGVLAGAGLALFFVFLVSGVKGVEFTGPLKTVTGFAVTPFVGLIEGPFDPIPEAGEVEEVFSVPLTHVLDRSRYSIEGRRWMGEWRRFYAVPYGPHYIWGATARMLRGLAERAAE